MNLVTCQSHLEAFYKTDFRYRTRESRAPEGVGTERPVPFLSGSCQYGDSGDAGRNETGVTFGAGRQVL